MDVDRLQYLVLLALCLAVTAPLEALGSGVYRRPARLARAVLPIAAVLTVWDLLAVARGHWHYSQRLTTGVLLPGGLPVEELVFFLVIPVCTVLTYEAVTARVRDPWLR
ncbi:MAG: lycopene cyclase domain-containing protein [Kutzneria sp.]|nr:lycopene cyclase domain-containing protein [Kutzneria sp.]